MLGIGFCSAAILVTLLTCRGLSLNWSAQYCGKAGIDPAFDILHDQFLIDVVEKVMETSFVKLQCFVGGTGRVVKMLAAAGSRVLVEGTVKNQDRQSLP